MFSMNIGFAIAYALFAYSGSWHLPSRASKLGGHVLESFSAWLSHIAPTIVSGRTKAEVVNSALIREAVFIGIVIAIAVTCYSIVLLCAKSGNAKSMFATVSGLSAIAAVPVCWLYVVHATWGDPPTFWSTYGTIGILELTAAVGLVYLVRDRPLWNGAVVLVLHFGFWVVAVVERDFGNFIAPVDASLPLSFVFPFSAIAWLRYLQVTRRSAAQ